jgi:hypothetical protein
MPGGDACNDEGEGMRMRIRSQDFWLGIAVGAVLAAGAGIAYASIPDRSGTIHGCYDRNGTLRVIDSSRAACRKQEKALNWNQKGQAGRQGPPGPAGSVRGWAYVKPGTNPTIDVSRSRNADSVTHAFKGVYCVIFDSSIDMAKAAALASAEYGIAGTAGRVTAGIGCASTGRQGVQVNTFDAAGTPADEIPFYVLIP